MSGKIVVIGSSNTDMVIKTQQFPLPGETILGGDFFLFPGGKGANQAVAAARSGGKVTFIARIGNDIFGKQALEQFRKEGIHTGYIVTDTAYPSGVALITVDASGENTIVVAPGANGLLQTSDIEAAAASIQTADVVLVQLEIPLATVAYAIRKCHTWGKKVMLNPAPAQLLSPDIFTCISIITPNETEAEMLTGIKVRDETTAAQAAALLRSKGVREVVITMGAKGVFAATDTFSGIIPAPAVTPIDTTAAGDVFSGVLAVGISEGLAMEAAVEFANAAAAISVTKMGAQAAAPYRQEIIRQLGKKI